MLSLYVNHIIDFHEKNNKLLIISSFVVQKYMFFVGYIKFMSFILLLRKYTKYVKKLEYIFYFKFK